jgi:hypothetical protein
MLVLFAQTGLTSFYGRGTLQHLLVIDDLAQAYGLTVPSSSYVSVHGGWNVLPYQILRLIANLMLLALTIITAVLSERAAIGDVAIVIASVSGRAYNNYLRLIIHASP